MVKEFHETFGHLVAEEVKMPNINLFYNRTEFIESEVEEAIIAFEEGDLVEIADALGDIQYFLDGFFLVMGMHDYKDRIMAEIHRSNMSKSCATEEEVEATIAHHNGKDEMYYRKRGDRYIVYRTDTDKVVKSINFSEPNLKFVTDARK